MTQPHNTFERQIEAARQRLERLQQHAGGTSPEQAAVSPAREAELRTNQALEELSNALEELHVAGEELRQQNDELAASRQAVEAERQRYEELFEFAPDGYLVTDPEGVIQAANRAAAALLGVRQDFLAGKPLLVFVADATVGHAVFHTRLTQLQKAHGEKLQDWEIWLQPREGAPFPVEVTVGRVCDAHGRLAGLRWLLHDITRRKRAEEAVQLSEAHYRAIVEDQTEFILRFLPDGSLTFVNGAYCRCLGKTHEQVMERNLMLLLPAADRREIEKQLAALTPENPATTYELCAALPGGRPGWQQWTTRALYDDAGNLVEYQSVGRDITERKQMQDAQAFLLQAGYSGEDFFQSLARYLAESLGMDYVCIDRLLGDALTAQTVAIYFDGKFEDNVAYALQDTPCGEVVGQSVCCFPRAVRHLFPHDAVLQEMEAESYVGTTLWSSHGRPIGLIAVIGRRPLVNSHLAEFILKLVAVRAAGELERRQAEAALRQHALELEARNEELDAFDHTVAHDLKNPLSLVVGFSEALEDEGVVLSKKELGEHLHTLARSARTMGRIIDELLLLAGVRKAQAQIGPLDMADIVEEARARLSDLIEERQAEIVLPEASAWPVAVGHAEWIVEVWANYLGNSIKYGAAEGVPPRVELGAEAQPDGMVRFWVRDNGAGLSAEEQARLFTPFTRLNQVHAKGHGLGLSIVRRIVEKLGGQVGVASLGLPGQGSSFFFTLPGAASPTSLSPKV